MRKLTAYQKTLFEAAFDAIIAKDHREHQRLERYEEQEKQHATAQAMDEAALGENDE